jgi:hypothetical protein
MAFSRLGRRSRRRRDGGVPRWWETSQSVAADLHRRMHRSLDRARATLSDADRCGVPTAQYEALCTELESAADAIDAQLVQASQLPPEIRHKTLVDLRYRIADLERTAHRVARTAIDGAAPLPGSADETLRHVNERLDHYQAARAELRRLGPGA